jgi:hypothetical protein
MSVFAFIGCRLNRHKPLRRDVTWDGRAYIGQCRHCGAPIERRGHRKWHRRKTADAGKPAPSPL